MRQPSPVNTITCVQPAGNASKIPWRQTVSVVVDEVEAILVVERAKMSLSDGKTNCTGDTLAERAGGDLDTVGVAGFGVARRDRIYLAEALEIIEGDLVA